MVLANHSSIAFTIALVGIRAIVETLRQESLCSIALKIVVSLAR